MFWWGNRWLIPPPRGKNLQKGKSDPSKTGTKSVMWEFRNPWDGKYGNLNLNHNWVKAAKPTRLKCRDDAYHWERITKILKKMTREVGFKATTRTTPPKIGDSFMFQESCPIYWRVFRVKEFSWREYYHSTKLETLWFQF